jgi:AcrR family transcriptional regulator
MAGGKERHRPSLRERKKTKTRTAIQEHALRLFREQGYDRTSVEQIADAAEVSPSTFFRYFPTKEDVALYDPLDPILIEAFLAQPPELGPIAALRVAWRTVLGGVDSGWIEQQRERADLLLGVPELRRRMLDEFVATLEPFALAVSQRVGRPPDDFAVRNLLGAIIGVALVAWLDGYATGDYLERIEAGLAHLEAGVPV